MSITRLIGIIIYRASLDMKVFSLFTTKW